MSKVLRMLQLLQTRGRSINGTGDYVHNVGTRVFLGKEDLAAQAPNDATFPALSILEGEERTIESKPGVLRQELDLTVVGATLSQPDNPIVAGHQLWADMLRALFPEAALDRTFKDRLGGDAISFEYVGREIAPRNDGGKVTAVYLDCRIEYVLHVGNPNQ